MTNSPQAFHPKDIFRDKYITHLAAMNGHTLAACAVTSLDKEKDVHASAIWTFCLESGEARQLTRGDCIDDSPKWSPDGLRIAFLSDRHDGDPQIYVIPTDGGEASQLTHLKSEVVAHAWCPDGRRLLALCRVNVDPDKRREGADDIDLQRPPRDKSSPELIWRLPYKMDGQGYQLDSRVHLCLVDADNGDVRVLTRGDFDVGDAVWSPDGRRIAYTRTRDKEGEEHCSDLWMLEVDDGGVVGEPRRLTDSQSNAASPSWSPDGRWVSFTSSVEDGDSQMRLWLWDAENDVVRPLGSESIEVVAGGLHWCRSSRRLAFVRAHRGMQHIATITVPDGELSGLEQGLVHVAHLAVNDKLVYAAEGPSRPLEVWCAEWDGKQEQQLSHFNEWWKNRVLPEVSVERFEVPNGEGGTEQIEGWLLLPSGRKGPVPLLVDVHGGPASYVFLKFRVHAYWQVLCSRGWAILALNAVGSSSYGREFSERLRARWGELDLPQQLAAISSLQARGVVDDRVGIIGSSYGGYLSAWAIGHCDVFRAAVVCAPVANLETHFGTSDSGYYADPYSMLGKPEEDRQKMAELSPMSHIEKARTPTLFLQGKDDQRCPVGQSEEVFVKLKRAGKAPCEMVLYPKGSHHVYGQGKPSHRLDILERIVAWLEKWIKEPLPKTSG
jgi:dipeptidyl aminopeptidase/acylaminoacyl peptidase